jgi:hypothetical protein
LGPLATDPSRTTPDGSAIVFESLASLTGYDSEGAPEIYRYHPGAEQLDCISCPGPEEAPGDGANLQTGRFEVRDSPADDASLIAGITVDGSAAFFETAVALVPFDHNEARDVYEWRAGEVSLISTGGGEAPSYLYAMSSDGRDVFIATSATLLPSDTDGGARSIYDAREGGGFPVPGLEPPCQENACKGAPNPVPALPPPASPTLNDSGNVNELPARRRCGKGRRAVKRAARVRCVPKPRKGKAKRGAAPKRDAARAKGGRR